VPTALFRPTSLVVRKVTAVLLGYNKHKMCVTATSGTWDLLVMNRGKDFITECNMREVFTMLETDWCVYFISSLHCIGVERTSVCHR
jgi:hypothetical protein